MPDGGFIPFALLYNHGIDTLELLGDLLIFEQLFHIVLGGHLAAFGIGPSYLCRAFLRHIVGLLRIFTDFGEFSELVSPRIALAHGG